MKFCKYCGKEIEDDAIICSDCNGKASKLKQSSPAAVSGFSANRVAALFREKKKHLLIAAAAIAFIVVALVVVNMWKCHVSGCKNRVVAGSDYCYTHKCSVSDCPNRKAYSAITVTPIQKCMTMIRRVRARTYILGSFLYQTKY